MCVREREPREPLPGEGERSSALRTEATEHSNPSTSRHDVVAQVAAMERELHQKDAALKELCERTEHGEQRGTTNAPSDTTTAVAEEAEEEEAHTTKSPLPPPPPAVTRSCDRRASSPDGGVSACAAPEAAASTSTTERSPVKTPPRDVVCEEEVAVEEVAAEVEVSVLQAEAASSSSPRLLPTALEAGVSPYPHAGEQHTPTTTRPTTPRPPVNTSTLPHHPDAPSALRPSSPTSASSPTARAVPAVPSVPSNVHAASSTAPTTSGAVEPGGGVQAAQVQAEDSQGSPLITERALRRLELAASAEEATLLTLAASRDSSPEASTPPPSAIPSAIPSATPSAEVVQVEEVATLATLAAASSRGGSSSPEGAHAGGGGGGGGSWESPPSPSSASPPHAPACNHDDIRSLLRRAVAAEAAAAAANAQLLAVRDTVERANSQRTATAAAAQVRALTLTGVAFLEPLAPEVRV